MPSQRDTYDLFKDPDIHLRPPPLDLEPDEPATRSRGGGGA